MLQNLETLSREARSWPFEQARNLLAHVLKKRLSDAERDAAKLLTRVGMGMCQGRMCGDNAARVLAATRGISPADAGPFQAQPPVKPVLLGTLRDRCS